MESVQMARQRTERPVCFQLLSIIDNELIAVHLTKSKEKPHKTDRTCNFVHTR